MQTQTLSARDRLMEWTQNYVDEFHATRKEALDHVFRYCKDTVNRAISEDDQRKFENSMEGCMQQIREYQREGKDYQTHVRKVSELFRLNPDFTAHYERQVKGGNSGMRDASREIAQRAVTYSKENSVDIKTATREVMAEDPLLAQRWHFGSKSTHRYQEDSEPMEGIEDMESNSAYQRVGSVVIPLMGRGDMAAALKWASDHRRDFQQAGTEWLLRRGQQRAEALALPGLSSQVNPLGQSFVLRDFPELRSVVATGIGTAQSLLTMYPIKGAA